MESFLQQAVSGLQTLALAAPLNHRAVLCHARQHTRPFIVRPAPMPRVNSTKEGA